MKKIFLAIAFFTVSLVSYAQCEFTNFTISPTTYTAEDEITLTVDLTGTTLAGETDVYIWTWCNKDATGYPGKDGFTNTAWTNAPANAKLTAVTGQPNKFTYKMTGTLMYTLTPGELKHFQFLIKTKDGGKQSCDSKKNTFDPLVFIPSMMRIFPAKVGQNDVISVNFHQDLATDVNTQRMSPKTVTIEVFDNTNTSAGTPITLNLVQVSSTQWMAYFIPTRSYTPGTGKKFVKFTYKFNGTVQDANNAPVNVSTSTAEVTLTEMK